MAQPPVIVCPECEKKFRTKADVRGKKIKCPFCSEMFVVPMGESSTGIQEKRSPQPAAATSSAAAAANDDGEEGENADPYGVTTLDLSPRCPHCAEEMESAEAVVCLNCGYNTLTREWGKTEKRIGVSSGSHFLHLLPAIIVLGVILICIIQALIRDVLLPYWIASLEWLNWYDHESVRVWETLFDLIAIFVLGRYCYRRFVVKPMPDEVVLD
jgi:DNA-directed RNA polymerase subunit RPC12/RpoP